MNFRDVFFLKEQYRITLIYEIPHNLMATLKMFYIIQFTMRKVNVDKEKAYK